MTVSIEITKTDGKRAGLRDGEFAHTNLIQADFDDNPDPEALLESLKQDPHVRAAFASASRKAKAFIKVSPVNTIHDHDSAWKAVKDYCIAQGYGEIDKSPKVVNAICYISHDPHAILKDAIPLQWEPIPEPPPRPKRPGQRATAQTAGIVTSSYEDEPAEIKRRIQALASGMPWIAKSMHTIKQHLHIVDMRGIGSVWGPGIGKHIANTGDLLAAGEDLRKICESKQAKLLVLDPLSGAFGGNENDRTAVYDFVSSFRGWGDTAKCAMLVIGHLPKSAEGKAAGFSGSTAWEASARSMWRLSKKPLDDAEKHYWALEHTKSNYAQIQHEIPLVKEEFGWWWEASDKEEAAKGLLAYNEQKEKTDA